MGTGAGKIVDPVRLAAFASLIVAIGDILDFVAAMIAVRELETNKSSGDDQFQLQLDKLQKQLDYLSSVRKNNHSN